MVTQIIKPLQEHRGIEAFSEIVKETESQLYKGLLRSPFDIEISLLTSARVSILLTPLPHNLADMHKRSSRSPRVHERFQAAVSTLCNTEMRGIDLNWRDRFHAATLDRVLTIALELDRGQKSESSNADLWSDAGAPILATSEVTSVWSPGLTSSAEKENTLDRSPISTASTSSKPMSQSTQDSFAFSPTTDNSEQALVLSPPPTPTKVAQEARCDCGKIFRGSSCATNMQRHRRSTKMHNEFAQFECLQSGCDARFTRSDNRNHHHREKHHSAGSLPLSFYSL